MEAEIRERTDAYIHARHHHPAWQLLAARRAPLILSCLQSICRRHDTASRETISSSGATDVIAQVSNTYRRGDAQTLVENCGNTLILRCSAAEGGGTARFASQLIGEREIVRAEVQHSRSRPAFVSGGHRSQVTDSVSHRHVTESAVMPAEIEQLPDLSGYLKRASQPTWKRVALVPDDHAR